jgi:hypothetical protein
MGGVGSGRKTGPRDNQETAGGRRPAIDRADTFPDTGADTGPRTVTARAIADPLPGPTVTRGAQASEGLGRNRGDIAGQKKRARDRARRARIKADATDDPAPRRSAAAQIQEAHADAASMFGLPELELRSDEASRVARAFERGQDMTGFNPSGPLFEWAYIAYVLAGVYGRRIVEIMRRRAAEAAALARAPGAPGAPAARPAPAPAESKPAAFGTLPAPISAAPRTTQEQSASQGSLDPAGAGNRPPMQDDAAVSAALAAGAANVVGFERRIPGLPISTIEERLGGL